jgi:hypothetical protein
MFGSPPAQVSLTQVAICRVSRSILFPSSLAPVPSIWTALGRDYHCRGSAQERLAAVAWKVFLLAAGVENLNFLSQAVVQQCSPRKAATSVYS